jgi:hypothetical protein
MKLLLFVFFAYFFSVAQGWAEQDSGLLSRKNAVSVYFGPGSSTPLLDMAQFKKIQIDPYYIISAGYSRTLLSWNELIGIEAETQLTKHLEKANLFSMSGAIVVRWLKTPWSSALPGSSFAFGNGLSYANQIPEIESTHLSRTSNLLYHFLLEVSVPVKWSLNSNTVEWETLLRIHHRSGAFGMFNDVVGGSDFICIGTRYRFN